MATIFTIYLITNLINGKFYIGCTSRSLKERFQNGEGYRRQPKIYNDILKMGWDSFHKEVLYTTSSKEEASAVELFLIRTALRVCGNRGCYNGTDNISCLYDKDNEYNEDLALKALSNADYYSSLRRFYRELETPDEEESTEEIEDFWYNPWE